MKSIAETAAAESSLTTLFNAVKAAGLEETLSGEGNFTVFAPTNDAFDKVKTLPLLLQPMNKDLLSQILLRHVLPTRVLAGQIPRGMTTLKTVGGEDVQVMKQGSTVTIKSSTGTATVISADIMTSNGVVHLVDSVF